MLAPVRTDELKKPSRFTLHGLRSIYLNTLIMQALNILPFYHVEYHICEIYGLYAYARR